MKVLVQTACLHTFIASIFFPNVDLISSGCSLTISKMVTLRFHILGKAFYDKSLFKCLKNSPGTNC